MNQWYKKVLQDDDLSIVFDACDFFESEYQEATTEVDLKALRGLLVAEVEKRLPGIVGYRTEQWMEIRAIVEHLELRRTKIAGLKRRHYLEHYNRQLNPSTVEKYVEADEDVLAFSILINRVSLIQKKFEALSRHHEYLHFQLGNMSKLIAAGVNDAIL